MGRIDILSDESEVGRIHTLSGPQVGQIIAHERLPPQCSKLKVDIMRSTALEKNSV